MNLSFSSLFRSGRARSAFDDLKEAITFCTDISNRIRMNRRFSLRHQCPVLALDMRRQPGTGHGGQAQSSIGGSTVDVVNNFLGHEMTITRRPIAAIASGV